MYLSANLAKGYQFMNNDSWMKVSRLTRLTADKYYGTLFAFKYATRSYARPYRKQMESILGKDICELEDPR